MKMKIGDISTYIKRGITPKYVVENGYAVVNQKCIRDGKVNYEYIKYTDIHKKYNEEKKVKQGDILINSTGTGTLGRVAYVDKDASYTYVDSHVTILRCENYNSKFLYYWLSSLEKYIESLGKGSTNQIELNKDAIEEIEIPKLDLEQQNLVVENLSTYDDLIENNQKQIKLLEEAAQRLYKEWFVDLHFPGYEDIDIVDGVPEGWTFGVLGDVAINSGKKEKKEKRDNYKYYLPIDCIPKKSLGYIQVNDVSLAKSSLIGFQKGDIIFGAMRPYFHKVVVARDKGLTRTTCFVLNAKDPSYWSYLAMLLFTKDTVDYATQISVGTTMPYVRWNDMRNMPVIIPDLEIAERFNKQIQPIIDNIASLSEQVILLQQARDRLSPKLMSGEIEV